MRKVVGQYLTLLREGRSIKDKFAIFVYLLWFPLRVFYKKTGLKFRHSLIYGISIKNSFGTLYVGDNIFPAWTASSTYEKKLQKFFDLEKGIFIDVGANIGRYSVLVGKKIKKNGKVISLEPMEDNFNMVLKNISQNGLTNIKPLKIALGNKNGRTEFYIDEEGAGGGGHSLIKKQPKKVVVSIKKLDTLVKELQLKRIDLIKIDVEGAEADVLRGAKKSLKKFHPKIIFEAWNEKYLKEINSILDKLEYQTRKIDKNDYLAYPRK